MEEDREAREKGIGVLGRPTGRMAGLTGRSEDEVVELQPTGVAGREKGGSGMDSQIEWIQTRRRKRKLVDEASLRKHSEEKRGKKEERREEEEEERGKQDPEGGEQHK